MASAMNNPMNKPPLFNKIFIVYGKDNDVSQKEFREHFQDFGTITSLNISKDKASGRPKGYTYIGYEKTSEACLAMEEMDNKSLSTLDRKIGVHLAHNKQEPCEIDVELDNMLQRICIRHRKDETEQDLREHFGNFGEIVRVIMLKDKSTGQSKGVSFIKYEKQSMSARALEECQQRYKPRWADVRRKVVEEGEDWGMGERGMGGFDRMGGGYSGMKSLGYGGGMDMMDAYGGPQKMQTSNYGGGMDMMDAYGGPQKMQTLNFATRNQYGFDDTRMAARRNMALMRGATMSKMGLGNGSTELDSGPKVLEAMVPPGLSRQQVFRLFDIAQGLESCSIDSNSGLARLEYDSGKNAAHAKEKIDGLDIFGQSVAIRYSKTQSGSKKTGGLEETAMKLEESVRELRSQGRANPQKLNYLMNSLEKVTQALREGAGGPMGMDDEGDTEAVSWCNIPLPVRKPMLPRHAVQQGKVFFLTVGDAISSDMLLNVFSRFGSLIMAEYLPGKRFGFANYASKESALGAIETLNGCFLRYQGQDIKVKAELSNQGVKDGEGDDASPRKRQRQF